MQNFSNHTRYVPLYHFVLSILVLLFMIGSFVNLYQSWGDHERFYSSSLLCLLGFILVILYWFTRSFALKAQDRAIRAEENLRHLALTGKLLDSRLSMGQVIALRFAPDEEFVALAKQAADSGMSSTDIKKAIKNWRADEHRL